jgi:hypothetical protein
MRKIIYLLVLTVVFILSIAVSNAIVGTLTINSPVNGSVYNAAYFQVNDYRVGRIPIDLLLNETTDFMQISYDSITYKTLCKDCDNYNQTAFFGTDKDYTLTFRALDEGSIVDFGSITFTKDTTSPKIIRQMPRKNSYTNGTNPVFKVTYNEQKLGNITLFYKKPAISIYQHATLVNCTEGINQVCNTTLNLTSYNGQQLMYYFSITDKAGNTINKTPTTINVDTVAPILTIIQPQAGNNSGGSLLFEIAADETLDLLQYELDYSNKWILFCRKCDHRSKNIFISTTGDHTVTFRGTDYVGQVGEQAINLTLS